MFLYFSCVLAYKETRQKKRRNITSYFSQCSKKPSVDIQNGERVVEEEMQDDSEAKKGHIAQTEQNNQQAHKEVSLWVQHTTCLMNLATTPLLLPTTDNIECTKLFR